jgi:hypothetical protein
MASITSFTLKSLFDGMMGAAKVLLDAGKIPEYKTVIDAYTEMHKLQSQVYDLDSQLREVKEELKRVQEDQASAEGSAVWAGLLWIPNDDDAYCVHCWDVRKRLFHVNMTHVPNMGIGSRCPECTSQVINHPRRSYWDFVKEKEAREADKAATNLIELD